MTYLSFLMWFVVTPALLLALALHWSDRSNDEKRFRLRRHWVGTSILALIALVWTTPWDNAIIAKGVWSYGSERVLGTIGLVPVEEYAFIVLMPFFNAGIMGWLIREKGVDGSRWRLPQPKLRHRALSIYAVIWVVALGGLAFEPAFYLSSILVWFIPALALQSLFDPASLLCHWRLVAVGTLIPTIYFSIVDAFAIHRGIWTIHDSTRTGLEIGNLPFEEAFFFFTTSLLLAQGLVLWHTLCERTEK